ncbi:MAG: small subunit ribosomal protein S21 [Rickettsiales bacterium]|jgi:small subunit ribosomal protein S21
MQVVINNKGHLEMAIRSFRKKTQKEGIIKEARRRQAFEKPSEENKRKKEESLAKTKRSRRRSATGSF